MLPPPPIRRLPQMVADAIAAGEVVERPASVVKELCENALDAGATAVDIGIEGGGLVRIAVADDGAGIAADELELAVMRHATSKIAVVDDLTRVASLGFRGEALASIAAVADVTITSATGDLAAATLHARVGEVLGRGAAGRSRGTTVEVCDLFFNTPARLRFLRSARAETSAAGRVVADMALTHPEVAITSRNDGRILLRSPGTGLDDALGAVFGAAAARELLEVTGEGPIGVGGRISQPRVHRGTRGGLVVVVNGRRVHNRALSVAVEEAYRGLIPGGRHPYGVIRVDLDPADVDVNVHPTKREVRFRDESSIFVAVQRACWGALQGSALYTGSVAWTSGRSGHSASIVSPSPVLEIGDANAAGPVPLPMPWRADIASGSAPPAAAIGADTGMAGLGVLSSLGQAGNEWLVAWSAGRVVLIDPHAAHERILFEEIQARWDHGRLDPAGSDQVQMLLIPAIVECDPSQLEAFAHNANWLTKCGFVIDTFGPNLLRCSAVPAAASRADTGRLVGQVLDALGAGEGMSAERRHRVAALLACHSAVRFGDHLDESEQQRLLSRLAETPNAMTCPHGRPTVMVLDDAALRRAFRRPAV